MKILPPGSDIFDQLNWENREKDFVGIQFFDARAYTVETLPSHEMRQSILVSNELIPEQIVRYFAENKVKSLVQRNKNGFLQDLRSAASSLLDPKSYFSSCGRNLLGTIEKETEIHFATTGDKSELKQQIEAFVSTLGSQNVSESAELISEELYMNAMFDAPREAARLGYSKCSYEMGMFATLRLMVGDKRLVITCEDPFGSLTLSKFVNRMNEVYKKGAGDAINLKGNGGAGLGCVIIFEHCESLHVGVIPGQKTLVSAVIPLGLSYRQRDQIKKSLQIVEG